MFSLKSLLPQPFAECVEAHLWKALLLIPVLFLLGPVIPVPILHWTYEMTLSEIWILILSGVYVVYLLSPHRKENFHIPPVGQYLLVLYALAVLSIFWIENFEKYLIAIRVMTYQGLTFFLVYNLVRNKTQALLCLASTLLTGLVAVGFVASAVIQIPYAQLVTFNRAWILTPIGAVSFVAAIMAMLVPVALGFYHESKTPVMKVLSSLLYSALVVGVLYAAGKAAILSVLCGLIVALVLVKRKRIYLVALTVLSVALFFSFTVASTPHPGGYTVQRFEQSQDDSSTSFRITEYAAARDIFLAHPIIGVGAGNLKMAYKKVTGFYEGEANNIVLQIATELGALGLLIFALLIAKMIHYVRALKPSHLDSVARPILLSFLTVVAINAMFEVTLVGLMYGVLFFYIFAAVGLLNEKPSSETL